MRLLVKIYFAVAFLFFYLVKLVQANFYIAWDILTPRMHTKPGILEIDVDIESSFGVLLFSNLLSMTPGTLSMDLSADKKKLLVHVLYNQNQEATLREIEEIKKRIKKFAP
jgi:multisubunit Na+/H+ antiporter MnhE subunit